MVASMNEQDRSERRLQPGGNGRSPRRGNPPNGQSPAAASRYSQSGKGKINWRASSSEARVRPRQALERDFGGFSIVSTSIGEPLANHAFDGFGGAPSIRYAKRDAFVVAEIELAKVALQMLLRDVVIGAHDPALEDGEVAFDRVGVSLAAHVLTDPVVDRFVFGEHRAENAVLALAIGHQERRLIKLRFKDGAQGLCGDIRDVLRPDLAAALDDRKDGFLARAAEVLRVSPPCVFVLFPAAHERLIRFGSLTGTTHRSGGDFAHAF